MKKVTNWYEYNLLHDILNLSKRTKKLNSHYYSIWHGCMHIRQGKTRFKDFRILLDSWCGSMIIMVRIINKITPKKDSVIKCHTKSGKITNNLKVKIDFTLTEIIATRILTWTFHVDDSTKGRYNMILGRYLLT